MLPPPRLLTTSGEIWTFRDWLNNFCNFSVPFVALTASAIDGCGPSNKMCRQLQPKKIKVMLSVLAIFPLYITNKKKYLVLKVGVLHGWRSI